MPESAPEDDTSKLVESIDKGEDPPPSVIVPVDVPVLIFVAKFEEALRDVAAPDIVAPPFAVKRPVRVEAPVVVRVPERVVLPVTERVEESIAAPPNVAVPGQLIEPDEFVIKQYVVEVEPPPMYISPLLELPILIAPVPLAFREIDVFVVPGYIDGEEPAKTSLVSVRVSELIAPVKVIFLSTVRSPVVLSF